MVRPRFSGSVEAQVGWSRRAWARSRIPASPLSSPIGRAPDRHSFIPLYAAGLWLAVNITAGASRAPLA